MEWKPLTKKYIKELRNPAARFLIYCSSAREREFEYNIVQYVDCSSWAEKGEEKEVWSSWVHDNAEAWEPGFKELSIAFDYFCEIDKPK